MFDKHAKSYAEQQLRMRNVRQRRALKFATRIHAYIVSVYVCRVYLGVRINNHIHIKIAFGLQIGIEFVIICIVIYPKAIRK